MQQVIGVTEHDDSFTVDLHDGTTVTYVAGRWAILACWHLHDFTGDTPPDQIDCTQPHLPDGQAPETTQGAPDDPRNAADPTP